MKSREKVFEMLVYYKKQKEQYVRLAALPHGYDLSGLITHATEIVGLLEWILNMGEE